MAKKDKKEVKEAVEEVVEEIKAEDIPVEVVAEKEVKDSTSKGKVWVSVGGKEFWQDA